MGDVVISWETALRQALERKHTVEEEMKRLLVHGVLHLLGFDHEGSEGEVMKMKEMEEKYLKTGD